MVADAVQPGASRDRTWCVRNVGIQAVALDLGIAELTNRESACTGDERELDTTCGNDGAPDGQTGAGELAEVIRVSVRTVDCASFREAESFSGVALLSLATPRSLAISVAPNETVCLRVITAYPSSTPVPEQIKAQSDRVTFRYVFGGGVVRS